MWLTPPTASISDSPASDRRESIAYAILHYLKTLPVNTSVHRVNLQSGSTVGEHKCYPGTLNNGTLSMTNTLASVCSLGNNMGQKVPPHGRIVLQNKGEFTNLRDETCVNPSTVPYRCYYSGYVHRHTGTSSSLEVSVREKTLQRTGFCATVSQSTTQTCLSRASLAAAASRWCILPPYPSPFLRRGRVHSRLSSM